MIVNYSIIGYCMIKADPVSHKGLGKPEHFKGIIPFIKVDYLEGRVITMPEPGMFGSFKLKEVSRLTYLSKTKEGYICPIEFTAAQKERWDAALLKQEPDKELFNATVIGIALAYKEIPKRIINKYFADYEILAKLHTGVTKVISQNQNTLLQTS
jgi:hypothetical protein